MQYKLIIIIVAVVIVLGTIGGIYGSLKLKINTLNEINEELRASNSSLSAQLAAEKLNVSKLKLVITNVNNELNKISIKNSTITKELEKWKQGTIEVTNKNKALEELLDSKLYLEKSCQTGLHINELLGAVKYEDL